MPRVLLADDSPHAQRMGIEILSQEGFEVLGITDGLQVMDTLGRFAPDLVLADVGMPHHSGYEICEHIKTNPALGHVKVVLLVGALEQFDKIEAERVGADGVLRKPFEPAIVIEMIGPLLRNERSPEPQRPDGKEVLEQAVQAALGDERIDRGQVRAAVVLAMESALPAFLEELTERVLDAISRSRR